MNRLRDIFNLLRWEFSRSTKRVYRNSAIAFVVLSGLLYFYDVAEHFLHWLPDPPEKFLYIIVAILVLAGILHLFHQIEQWKESKRERRFAKSVVSILDEFSGLDFRAIAEGNDQVLTNFVKASILKLVTESLFCRKPTFSVMLQPNQGSRLEIFYHWPPEAKFGDFKPLSGEGAAGLTFEDNQTVYVPITKHRWGMKLSKEGLLEGWDFELFEKSSLDPFKCVLCVPISARLPGDNTGEAGNVFGVLNLHSKKAFGIKDFDMDIAQVTARLLALVFDRREKERYLLTHETRGSGTGH